MTKTVFFCFCLTVLGWSQASDDSKTYRGAVVEYSPVMLEDENARVSENVAKYVTLMKAAKAEAADIIVFPENGLQIWKIHSPIPDPSGEISPCDTPTFVTTEVVRNLSCASKQSQIYSVVNLPEKRDCKEGDKKCPDRGYYLYNTNVAFDRKGVVVARYSKFNPYDEAVDKTQEPDISYFDTDFGFRFGTFICFDILFSEPALRLVREHKVTNFVFTTHWFSELPFLTALQVQRGWAEANNVNLLASGVNHPATVTFGSGIYNGRHGPLAQTMPETTTTKLLIATVAETTATFENYSKVILFPDDSDGVDGELDFKRDQMNLFHSKIIEPGKTFDSKICEGSDLCCSFRVSVDLVNPNDSKKYTLRAVVLDGVRKFGLRSRGGVQCCGVLVCGGPHIANCTDRIREMPQAFRFNEIKISGEFRSEQSFQMPITLTDGTILEPLPIENYAFKKIQSDGTANVSLELVKPVTNLQVFAVWGRNFRKDSGAAALLSAPLLLVAVVSVQMLGDFF